MAENQNINTSENNTKIELEAGTYEIIRKRLDKYGNELSDKISLLNNERRKVFGSADAALIATERIITENNCIPSDMQQVGNMFIFAYNVSVRKKEIAADDVFSIYSYQNHTFKKEPLDLISDTSFLTDFADLYKYRESTRFVKFSVIGIHLFMLFRTGSGDTDIKAFKWIIDGNRLRYVDNRSDLEFRFPAQHEFAWTKATREMHITGKHPHVSIENILFVETVGGDLTIKAENNTETGSGVYAEPVENADQTLDDAEFFYSVLGNIIILKIRPFKEIDYRYIVYSSKTKSAVRIDAIKDACVLLPDNQGIIFSNGYYLQTGDFKFFENNLKNLVFEKRIDSPNGEDYIYTFYERNTRSYVLLKYNLIEQKLDTPIICNGFSIFENGEMCNFRSDGEAKKHHVVQIWRTTFYSADYDTVVDKTSYLFKIGNKELVKGIAECREVITLLAKDDSYTNLYIELVRKTSQILDNYYWISRTETFELNISISAVKEAAASAIDEYEKVAKIKKNTLLQTQKITGEADKLFAEIKNKSLQNIEEFVHLLARLRIIRGELISLKQLRYIKLETVEEYEKTASEYNEKLSESCVAFLLEETALNPYNTKVEQIRLDTGKISKVTEANDVENRITQVSGELEMLIEIVSNLKIKDAVQTAKIIDTISSIYSNFNKIKADLKRKRDELFLLEGKAEFSSQIKLIGQAVVNYLDLCDAPEKTDEYLTKLLVQIEELEGKFTEFDEFVNEIGIKREEILDAFEQRKIQLTEKRSKRTDTLKQSAERILKAVSGRLAKLGSESEINGYFASDIMVDKVRDIVKELFELGDNVKADDIQSKLKTAKEDAFRQLRDKVDLFVEGEDVIKFGRHNFTVNKQPLALTMVNRGEDMFIHLSGTGFYERVENEEFYQLHEFWAQNIISENDTVYRSEYLAYKFLNEQIENNESKIDELFKAEDTKLVEMLQNFMSVRYSEGYEKGVHDSDALVILKSLIEIRKNADLLRYSSKSRAAAELWFKEFAPKEQKELLHARLQGIGAILESFPGSNNFNDIKKQIENQILDFTVKTNIFSGDIAEEAAEYLFAELTRSDVFVLNSIASKLYTDFNDFLKINSKTTSFKTSTDKLKSNPEARYLLIREWIKAFASISDDKSVLSYVDEVAVTVFTKSFESKRCLDVTLQVDLVGLEGNHSLISDKKYHLNFNEFMRRLKYFDTQKVVGYKKYTELKKQLTESFENELRLNEFKPRVMSSFVRNRLIDKVYLPLIGTNLAKQIGTAGEQKRTDLMGMLLLISPPGYGKTTLMEYIANRLGIIFIKINGPALGHSVTSVDPQEAPNATAREELMKLNLAFEIGDNVMIYVDDIQHCHPEFLQKFISLADAQRKIEGVYKGRTKTYDFRGKKVCIIMAGNPYTESGDVFKIPDMLANRADIYNLGDILGDSREEFLMSYIENSLTSNTVLNQLSGKSRNDVYTLIDIAQNGQKEGIQYEANHSSEEIKEYLSVLEKLLKIREIVNTVNQQYIYSAGQAEAYRIEPPFKLQGSYRDMNKLSEKVMPILNDAELETLILSHYENESQTLTSGAEANLLKFKKMTKRITAEEDQRFSEIIAIYQKNKQTDSGSQIALISKQMGAISQGLDGIVDALKK